MHNYLYSFLKETRARAARVVLRGVCQLGSRRILRLIYISSIVGAINESRDVDKAMAHKLNAMLTLTNVDDAVVAAAGEHSVVWGDVNEIPYVSIVNGQPTSLGEMLASLHKPNVSKTLISEVAEGFARYAPSWVRYGSEKLMRQDVEKLLMGLPKLMA